MRLPPLLVLLIAAVAPVFGASAAPIRYAWTGFLEPGDAPGNPWNLSGDGSAVTQDDGTPLSIEVFVDQNASDGDIDEPGFAEFVVDSGTILIGGAEAQIVSLELVFADDDPVFAFDTIQVQGLLTLVGTTLSFGASARLPIDTFAQGPGFTDLPPLFADTTPIQFGGFGGDVLTYPADATVSSTLIPEPTTVALLAFGLCALAARRRSL